MSLQVMGERPGAAAGPNHTAADRDGSLTGGVRAMIDSLMPSRGAPCVGKLCQSN